MADDCARVGLRFRPTEPRGMIVLPAFGYLAGGFFVGHVVADVETLLPEALTTR
jgi:hypothetical protein